MGTASYMSPEQVRREKLDTRTDLFSFGAVLYEMAVGQKAFAGDTAAEVHNAILNHMPAPARQMNPNLPLQLEHIINKALQKDRELRYQAASEMRAELMALKRDTGSDRLVAAGLPRQNATGGVKPPLPRHRRGVALGLATFTAALAIAYLFRPTLPPPQVLSTMQITSDGQSKGEMATDGSRLYFHADMGGSSYLYQVSTGGGTAAPIATALESPLLQDVSRDGSQLLVIGAIQGVRDDPIFTVPVLGGSPHRLNGLVAWEAAWSPDGRQLVYTQGNGVYAANADGTASRKLVAVDGVAWFPRWSPDMRKIRFSLKRDSDPGFSIWEVSADGNGLHQLLPPGFDSPPSECCGTWTPDGKYFFFQSSRGGTGNVWAIREGGSSFFKVNHQPVQLTTGLAATIFPLPSRDGKKLFAITAQARGKLVRYDTRTGEFVPYLNGISATCVDFSRDGQWMAYVQLLEHTLWRSKIDGSNKVQLTFQPMTAVMLRWSPDGAQIAFIRVKDGLGHPYLIAADGTGTPQQVPSVPGEAGEMDPGWSPDGKSLVFSGTPPAYSTKSSPNAIHIMDVHTRKLTTLQGSAGLYSPRWSSDGRYIAALTNNQQHLMVYDLSAKKWSELVANLAVAQPAWSRDSQAIYFLGFPTGKPAAIFRVRLSDHRMEQVASLEHLRVTTTYFVGVWMGLAPDNSPLLVEDVGSEDIYALDVKLP